MTGAEQPRPDPPRRHTEPTLEQLIAEWAARPMPDHLVLAIARLWNNVR